MGKDPGQLTTRSAESPEDIRACVGLFFEAFNDLHARRGLPPEDPADDAWIATALTDLLRTDPERVRLAEEDGEPVAFGAAYRRQQYWFLSFLFVAPRVQGRGLGRRLVQELLPAAHERTDLVLATVVEAIQPVSTALYASYGLAPRTPMYRLSGTDRLTALPELPPGVTPVPLTQEMLDACTALDRGLLGYERPQDLSGWIERLPATAFVDDGGSLLGYGLIDEDWIVPIASGGQRLTAAILRELLGRIDRPDTAKVSILGWSGALMAACLEAGMRLAPEPPFIYCSSDGRRPDPAYIPNAAYQV